ncbi:hypothetical protein ACWGDT_05130, partial [Streptomyces avermitilis]
MRRCARVLSATALAGAALGVAAPAASADPATDVRPRSVAPGGVVTLSDFCDATDAVRSDAIEVGPQGSEEAEVQLQRLGGNDDTGAAADSETARIPSDGNVDGGATGAAGPPSQWGADGQCPATPGGQEGQWTASSSDTRDGETGETGDGAADASGTADASGAADAPDA